MDNTYQYILSLVKPHGNSVHDVIIAHITSADANKQKDVGNVK